jgi:hypothetical protein
MEDLKSWGQLETGHDSTLASVVSCARAVVCRLPLTNGAKPSRYCKLILGQLGGFTMVEPADSVSLFATVSGHVFH